MTQQQQEQEKNYKPRLAHLKKYISHIKQEINFYDIHHRLPLPPVETLSHSFSSSPNQQLAVRAPSAAEVAICRQEKVDLQHRILQKQKQLCGLLSNGQKNTHDPHQIRPYFLRVNTSRARASETLGQLGLLLEDHDWEYSSLFQQQWGLVIVGTESFSISRIKFAQIEKKSLEIESKYLRFLANVTPNKYYTLNFASQSEAAKWYRFLFCLSNFNYSSLQLKWQGTQIKHNKQLSQQSQASQMSLILNARSEQVPKPSVKKLMVPQQSDSLISPMRFNFKRKVRQKQQPEKSSFYLSNSSDKNNQQKPMKAVEQMNESFEFVHSQEEIRSKQKTLSITNKVGGEFSNTDNTGTLKNIHSSELQRPEPLAMTIRLLTKLEEKRKLLSQSSATRLGIHWHEDEEKYSNHRIEETDTEKYVNSPTSVKLMSHHKSISSRNNEPSTRRDSNQSPIKRVESATRHKSNSRESQEIEAERKKTDFSLQLERVEESKGKKKSSKHEIRDHYLQKLIEKETIKQISKSSGKDSSSQMERQEISLLPIPQRLEKRKPTSPNLSRYGSIRVVPDNSGGEDSLSQQQKESTELEIQIQQLKNGIVLQKCSKEAWSTKEKKLYISNAMNEICYCDVHNSHEEKKYFIKDIKSIEYGRVSKGILKHKKKRCDERRCLLIRIDNNGKQKLLEFYLDEAEAVQNLMEFSRKLRNFVQQQNEQSENQSD